MAGPPLRMGEHARTRSGVLVGLTARDLSGLKVRVGLNARSPLLLPGLSALNGLILLSKPEGELVLSRILSGRDLVGLACSGRDRRVSDLSGSERYTEEGGVYCFSSEIIPSLAVRWWWWCGGSGRDSEGSKELLVRL